MTVVLDLVYRRTRFGLATSAVAEDEEALAALGHSPGLVAAVNWTVGSALAGLAGILVAPITGLSPQGIVLLVIPALAAALFGSFTSFRLTLLGAILIGVIESEAIRYVHQPGLGQAVPFLVIIVLMSVRGRALPLRGERTTRVSRLGAGGISASRLAPVLALALVGVVSLRGGWLDAATTTLIFTLFCLSLVVVTGFNGRAVFEALDGLDVRFQSNPRYREGQMTSVAAGVAALQAPCDAVMICLADMVLLRADDYRELAQAFLVLPRDAILVPHHDGQRGNPVVFAASRVPEVLSGQVNPGCRHLIEDHPQDVVRYEAGHDRCTTDMDTPDDYARIRRRLAGLALASQAP